MRGSVGRWAAVFGLGACALVAGSSLARAVLDDGGEAPRDPSTAAPAAVAPEAPGSVAVRPTGASGELAVTWSAPAEGEVTGYRVAAEDGRVVEVPADATEAVVEGLEDEEAAAVVVTALVDGAPVAAEPVRGTPRSLGAGGCSGATITWDGSAGTVLWTTATNWDLDRVPTTTDHVCIPDGAVVDAPWTRPTVLSLASGGDLSLPGGIALTDTATPSLLSVTDWSSGAITGSVVVVADGELLALTSSSKPLEAHLVVDGTLRVEGTGLAVACTPGSPSGVDVAGVLELATNGVLLTGTGTACTPTVKVRSTGVLDKVAGTGTSTVRTAVDVAGAARATTGTLALQGGTQHTDWDGTAAGTSSGATTGTIGATGGSVQLGGNGGRQTWHLATGSVLAGSVAVTSDGTLAGQGAIDAAGTVQVWGGGILDADLSGGAITLNGGEWHADVLPGVARTWQSGTLAGPGITVAATAAVQVTGTIPLQTSLLSHGTVQVTSTGSLGVTCQPGRPSGYDNRGILDLDRNGIAVTGPTDTGTGLCTATVWNRSTGTIRKAVGTGTTTVQPAVVNAGLVEATTGSLVLTGGSATVGGSGATSGSGSGPSTGASSGTYRATAPHKIYLQGASSTARRTFTLASGSSLAGVEVSSYATLAGDGSVATGGTLTIAGLGALSGNVGGGTIRLAGGEWRGDVLVGEGREWVSGTIKGDQVKVRGGATVRVLGQVSVQTNLLNRGTIRVEAQRLDVVCTPGTPSGIDNEGTIEVPYDGWAIMGTTTSGPGLCTATIWNRSDGVIRKPSGTSTSAITVAVVNEGIVAGNSGTLRLSGGSAYTGWNGATSGAGSETATGAAAGIFRSAGTGKVQLSGDGPTATRAYALAPGAALNGALEVSSFGTLTGTGSVGTAGAVTIGGSGVLDADLSGGTVKLAGGEWRADVHPGLSREWATGTIAGSGVDVAAGASLRTTGTVQVRTAVDVAGTLTVDRVSPAVGVLAVTCTVGQPSNIEVHGTLALAGDGYAVTGSTATGAGVCTTRVRVHASGTVRKDVGTGPSSIEPAVDVAGTVVATDGRLLLWGGSAWVDPSGVASDGALTGQIVGTAPGSVELNGPSSTQRRTYAVAGGSLGGTVRLQSNATLTGSGSVQAGGTLWVGGTAVLEADLAGGTVRLEGGTLKADVGAGSTHVWGSGTVQAPADAIAADATVDVTGQITLSTVLANHGTIRYPAGPNGANGGSLGWWCSPGTQTGLVNHGMIELLASSTPFRGSTTTPCTSTFVNRSGGVLRQAGTSVVGTTDVAVVNQGTVDAVAGTLYLRGGTENTDAAGVASTGAATGTFSSSATGVVTLAEAPGSSGVRRRYHLDGATLGNVGTSGQVDLLGTGTVTTGRTVALQRYSVFDAELGGGTVTMDRGEWRADVLPGEARTWIEASIADLVEIRSGAEVVATGVVWIGTHVENRGSLEARSTLRLSCTTGSPSGFDNHGLLALTSFGRVEGYANVCTPTIWNRSGAEIRSTTANGATVQPAIVNQGLVRAATGPLVLTGGSETTDGDGSSTGTLDGTATGEYRADAGAEIRLVEPSGNGQGGPQRRYHLDDATITGAFRINRYATVLGTGTIAPGGVVTIMRGSLAAELGGGTIILDDYGEWAADVLPGEAREWRNGGLTGVITVREGAAVTMPEFGKLYMYQDRLVNRGEITMGRLAEIETIYCEVGQPAGIDNHGTIEMGEGATLTGGSVGGPGFCTATIRNRPSGALVKTGIGTAGVELAIINEGAVRVEQGFLSLRGGTEWAGWDGTSGGSGTTAPTPGSWVAEPGATLQLYGDLWCCTGNLARTYHLRGDDLISGRIDLNRFATLTGADGVLQPGSLLTVASQSTLDMSLAGGTIILDGGYYSADDVLDGEDSPGTGSETGTMVDVSRLFRSGYFDSTVVEFGATLRLDGSVHTQTGADVVVEGTMVWPAQHPYPICSTCSLEIDDDGYLDIIRDQPYSAYLPQFAVIDEGAFHNDGLVRISGTFPGVVLTFESDVAASEKGMATMSFSHPGWLEDLEDSEFLREVAEVATGSPVGRLLRDLKLAFQEDRIAGHCVTVSGSYYVGGAVQGCAVRDDEGNDGIAISVGPSMNASFGSGSVGSVTLDAGNLVGYAVPTGADVTIDDLRGPFICFGGSGTFYFVGVTGSHCWGPEADTPFDLDASPLALAGLHTDYTGIAVSSSMAGVTLSVSASYTVVVSCDDWSLATAESCPVPPEITGTSATSAYQTGTGRYLTIYGEHLSGTTSVSFQQLTPSTTYWCPTTVIASTPLWVTVQLPNHCSILGTSRIVVATSRGGPNDDQDYGAAGTFTWVEDPPP